MSLYIAQTLAAPFEEALARTRDALLAQGFGVITEIDVSEVFKRKLGLDFRSYRILGACNPAMAHAALSLNDSVGLLLPCNVVVQEAGENLCEIRAIDPSATMTLLNDPVLAAPAEIVAGKLKAALASLADGLPAASQPAVARRQGKARGLEASTRRKVSPPAVA